MLHQFCPLAQHTGYSMGQHPPPIVGEHAISPGKQLNFPHVISGVFTLSAPSPSAILISFAVLAPLLHSEKSGSEIWE